MTADGMEDEGLDIQTSVMKYFKYYMFLKKFNKRNIQDIVSFGLKFC